MKKANFRDISENAVKLLAEDWALVCAGNENGCNGMTVSWGGVGELWGMDVVYIFLRPGRYTKKFVDENGLFTLSFFGGEYKKELGYFGKVSGRDEDKFKSGGLTPVFSDGTVYPEQAKLVLVCRKIALYKLGPDGFLDKSIAGNYSSDDFHTMYVGEITDCYTK